MISVLIVDDEYLIRKLIISLVDWESLGFQIIAEADTGLAALDLIDKYEPQLVILDINIPMLDGIELSRIIARKYPEIKIMIVTGYDDAGHVRESLRAGVMDYVIKPIDEAELCQSLQKCRQEILRQRIKLSFNPKPLPEASPLKNADYFIHHKTLPELALDVWKAEQGFSYAALSLEIDTSPQKCFHADELNIWMFSLAELSEEFFSRNRTDFISVRKDNQIYYGLKSVQKLTVPFMRALATELIQTVANTIGISVSIGIGTPADSCTDMLTSHEASLTALSQKFFEGPGKVFDISSCNTFFPGSLDAIFDLSGIMGFLRNLNQVQTAECIHNVYKEIIIRKLCKDYALLVSTELINYAIKYILETGLDLEELFTDHSIFIAHMEKCETVSDLELWISRLYHNIIIFSAQSKTSKPNKLVNATCDYIQANFTSPELSLNTIAASLYVNPSYLSKIFKQTMQQSISEYIIDCRMKSAKKMIDQKTCSKITDITKSVGYTDPFYFSKSFKKYFGISPSRYIENKNSNI